ARFLEIKIRHPFGPATEAEIRRRVEARVGRGRVDVGVFVRREAAGGDDDRLGRVGVDGARLVETLRALAEIERASLQVGLELVRPNSLDVLRFLASGSRGSSDPATAPEPLFGVLEQALADLVAFRRREGEALGEVLGELATTLEQQVAALRETLPTEQARLGLRTRELVDAWTAAAGTAPVDPDRVAQEVALLLARGDVAEELARISSHLGQMRATVAATPQRRQGKTSDFLSQEMLREVTTIGSKITSHEGSRIVIEAKGTIERIREQVQNVE